MVRVSVIGCGSIVFGRIPNQRNFILTKAACPLLKKSGEERKITVDKAFTRYSEI
jgi:hypothetical protein